MSSHRVPLPRLAPCPCLILRGTSQVPRHPPRWMARERSDRRSNPQLSDACRCLPLAMHIPLYFDWGGTVPLNTTVLPAPSSTECEHERGRLA